MNLILNRDHTVKKVSNFTKKNTKNMQYALIDISTTRKGPIVTLVESVNFSFINTPIDIAIEICKILKYENIKTLIKIKFVFKISNENRKHKGNFAI